ncbi:MAG: alpha/beta fold hydrolase [Chitinophagaceae bacterium]
MRKLFIAFALLITFASQAQTDSLYITTSDSVKLFVKRAGSGKPVLFIHGGPGSNSAYFEYSGGNMFEKDVQLIYLDQRGCGRSDNAANKDYSLQRIVKDFEEVRAALGIQKWTLMPHSFGGILATEYAYQHPQAIASMVYLNCTINVNESAKSGIAKTMEMLPDMKAEDKTFLTNSSINLFERWFASFGMLDKEGKRYQLFFDSKEADSLHSDVTQKFASHWDMQQNIWNHSEYFVDFAPKTRQIKTPVLVIGGTRDFTIGIKHPELMQFPNAQVAYIGGGHALYMEHGAELYKAVAPFLRKG